MTDEIAADMRERLDALRRILEERPEDMDPREAEVLRLRLGLADGGVRTAEETAEAFGLTPERVRQIERRWIRRIRPPSRAQKIRDFIRDGEKI